MVPFSLFDDSLITIIMTYQTSSQAQSWVEMSLNAYWKAVS